MTATITTASQTGEKDLTLHLRNTVDTCFEENQYEAAITVLDEIRSRKLRPFPQHIRQLIYIALYPTQLDEDDPEEEAVKFEPGSPSKMISKKQKNTNDPPPKASTAAWDVLVKYARTNTPGSLARALPSYLEDPNLLPAPKPSPDDSFISRVALRLQRARCVWDILKEGFVKRGEEDCPLSPRKQPSRRSTRHSHADEDGWGTEGHEPPAPVSEHAWGVIRYSPLLLDQIPPSRAERAPRWDVEMPLDVAFYALQQNGEARRSLGVRLLALLINLGSTTLLDFPMFLNAASTRVSSLPAETLEYLFSALPVTSATAQFKVHLCRHALGGSPAPSKGRGKPQARARAQPRRRMRTEAADTPADANANADAAASSQDTPTATQNPGPISIARKYPAISTSDVLELVASPSLSGSEQTAARVVLCLKAELVVSYGLLQHQAPEGEQDEKWLEALRDGTLVKAVEEAFDPEAIGEAMDAEDEAYVQKRRAALLAVVSMWQL
ncbi:hypothetical protein C8Q77DRAFT_1137847 [Trametes polyzona]|nr:hypothetical protein C8Q77DRAFT_1137847 [Trametes polyzona]